MSAAPLQTGPVAAPLRLESCQAIAEHLAMAISYVRQPDAGPAMLRAGLERAQRAIRLLERAVIEAEQQTEGRDHGRA